MQVHANNSGKVQGAWHGHTFNSVSSAMHESCNASNNAKSNTCVCCAAVYCCCCSTCHYPVSQVRPVIVIQECIRIRPQPFKHIPMPVIQQVIRGTSHCIPLWATWSDGGDVLVCIIQIHAVRVEPVQVGDANSRSTAQSSSAMHINPEALAAGR